MTRPKAAGTTLTERKRQAILDAAAELFPRHGFPGTSMDQVATRAGVSKQTVYAQFASKEALFDAMVRGMTDGPAGQVQSGMDDVPPGATLAEHLTAYAIRQLEIARTPALMRLRRLAIAEAERFPDLGRALHDHGPGRAIAALAVAFTRWAAEGRLRVPDPQVAATHFNWLVMAEPVNRAMFLGDAAVPARPALRRHAAEAVRIFMAAYGPGAGAR
jgi:TetR/AcrR family transcriptional regulator, mexJK operon transcriptional repressor